MVVVEGGDPDPTQVRVEEVTIKVSSVQSPEHGHFLGVSVRRDCEGSDPSENPSGPGEEKAPSGEQEEKKAGGGDSQKRSSRGSGGNSGGSSAGEGSTGDTGGNPSENPGVDGYGGDVYNLTSCRYRIPLGVLYGFIERAEESKEPVFVLKASTGVVIERIAGDPKIVPDIEEPVTIVDPKTGIERTVLRTTSGKNPFPPGSGSYLIFEAGSPQNKEDAEAHNRVIEHLARSMIS